MVDRLARIICGVSSGVGNRYRLCRTFLPAAGRPAGNRTANRTSFSFAYSPSATKSDRLRQSMVLPTTSVWRKSCRVASKKSLLDCDCFTEAKSTHSHASGSFGKSLNASRRALWGTYFARSMVACRTAVFSIASLVESIVVAPLRAA